MLTKVEIDGVDFTSYLINYEYETTYGDILSEITLKFSRTPFWAAGGINYCYVGATLEVWRGLVTSTDVKIFSGYIEKAEPGQGIVTITGLDKLWDLVRKECTVTYESSGATGGKISEIFKDLVTTYGGLNADATTIQDSGTAYILDTFICNHADPFDRCKVLAEILNWQFFYDAVTDKVYFQPIGYTRNNNLLSIGTVIGHTPNIIEVPKWQYDTTEMVNKVTVVGAYQDVQTIEIGKIGTTTGYTTSSISLTYIPISVKVFGDAANPPTTLRVGGVPYSTITYDYYVDKTQKLILPVPGATFTNAWYYQIDYSYQAPIPVNLYDQTSIDNFGLFQKTVTYTDIRSVDDAETRGQNYLTKYAQPFLYTSLKVKDAYSISLAVGQSIYVWDAINTPTVQNTIFIINKHIIRYPCDYDELEVGDKYWRLASFNANILEKIKRAEEDQYSNSDMLSQAIIINNFPVGTRSTPQLINRYIKINTQTVSGSNIFILNSSTYGLLGTNKLGDTDMGAETLSYLAFPPNLIYLGTPTNFYSEFFVDTDFKDAGNTTGTWNTTNHQLTMTVGQQAQSNSVDYNTGTNILKVIFDFPTVTGSPVIYLSADGGSNWEDCAADLDGIHTFINPGKDLRWKMVATDSTLIGIIYLGVVHT
mgnify:CR=1 FL=1